MSKTKQESPMGTTPHPSKVTIAQSIFIGSVAGATEVLVDHPLWSIKTRMQSGELLTLNPTILYRGLLPNMLSMVPTTAMQVGLNRGFQKIMFKDATELSDYQRVGSAFFAGVGSSAVSCPTEMVMTHQGKKGGNFYVTASKLVQQSNWRCLFNGLAVTGMRDGVFTVFFLAGTPILKEKLKPFCSNDYFSSLAAGVGAGVGATLASQAFDTLKTVQQAAHVNKPVTLMDACKKTYASQGMNGFFKGGLPRGIRVVSAVTIMGLVKEQLEAQFHPDNVDEEHAEKPSSKWS